MTDIYIYTITKDEIDTQDFSRFENQFGGWPHMRGKALKSRFNSLAIFVDGYDDHLDEIYVIPEVRAYFTELHKRWPWWLYFVHNFEASLAILYLCLVDRVESHKRLNDPMCSAAFDPVRVLNLIQVDFGKMNYLMDRAGMSDQENDKRSQEIIDLFVAGNGGAR